MDGSSLPYVGLRLVGTDRTDGAELSLTAGTPQDGTWSATIHVPSTWNGTWEVNRLVATDAAWNRLDVDPSASADTRLKVTGTHRPAVTMRLTPDPLVGDGPLTVAGRFYYEDTGEGIGNQPIFFGTDNLCVEYQSEPNGTTKGRRHVLPDLSEGRQPTSSASASPVRPPRGSHRATSSSRLTIPG